VWARKRSSPRKRHRPRRNCVVLGPGPCPAGVAFPRVVHFDCCFTLARAFASAASAATMPL
jgi:hypothetical protein